MIYYLVQGEAYQYPDRMAEMADSGAEVIFLTWDKQIDGALYLPNSTFMQGRDFLLQHVLKNNYDFEYLVFMDGDAKIIKGSWQKFNNFLLNKKPQICLPYMSWNKDSFYYKINEYFGISLHMPSYQRKLIIDTQTLAFRNDIIRAIGGVMHTSIFDKTTHCFSCDIHLCILKYMVPCNIIQFNGTEISNDSHTDYPKGKNTKFIDNCIKQLGLRSLFPYFENKTKISLALKIIKLFIELFYLIPFPIKEFDAAKRAEYVKQCLQKMKTIDIPESEKAEGCINT